MNSQSPLRLIAVIDAADDRVEHWRGQITAAWRETVDGIFEVGRLLKIAHDKLKTTPKAWSRLTGRKFPQVLPFNWTSAEKLRLIGVAGDKFVSYRKHLPPDWVCIYLLTTLDTSDLERAHRDGVIRPDMKQADVRSFKRKLRDERNVAAIATIEPSVEIHHCAIEKVGSDLLADESVEAVITDPPYGEKALQVYSHLADFAARVLKPSGWCVVMTGVVFLPEIINRLGAKLTYRWLCVATTPGGPNARMGDLGLFQGYKPVLLFQKAPVCKIREWWSDVIAAKSSEQSDVIIAKAGERDKSLHPYQQSETLFSELVNRFSLPGALIADPFAGSGTTGRAAAKLGRHFWGCDVDANCAGGPPRWDAWGNEAREAAE